MTAPRVSVVNLGCRVNRAESDRMVEELVRAGFDVVDEDEAELVVINTCAVTGEAEAKTRKAVRRALALPLRPYVVATGCAVNLHPDEIEELSDRACAEPSKLEVVARAAALLGYAMDGRSAPGNSGSSELDLTRLLGRHRLGIKVQDGCDNRCTYCIVWKARGASRSVSPELVVEQVRAAAAAGVNEVVLTGVNLGRYDACDEHDEHVELDELLERVLRDTDIAHVRLSSVEPPEVTDRLLEAVHRSGGRVAPFFHLPLQSGCDATLARMGRLYDTEEYARVVERIRAAVPAAAISCDVIVGFPGETDDEFAQSLAFCERIGFARMHVFRYSPRPGTWAATAPDQVPAEVKAARSAKLREAAQRLARQDASSRVGTVEYAVIEAPHEGTLASFHRVVVSDADLALGSLVPVAIMECDEHGVLHGRVA